MLGERGETPPGYAFVGRGCHSFRSERGAATTPEGASVADRPKRRALALRASVGSTEAFSEFNLLISLELFIVRFTQFRD